MTGPVTQCQSCASRDLESVLFLGYQPLCNAYRKIGEPAQAETTYPLELLRCPKCELVQLGYVVPAELLFPADYPYTSGTTAALRDNFRDLASCAARTLEFYKDDLVVDIGSNDGTLLSNFLDTCHVCGITPENAAQDAMNRGVRTMQEYFSLASARDLKLSIDADGLTTKLITCTNCFAHIPDPHDFLEGVKVLLAPGGVFVVEVQYLYDTLEKNYFDTIYAEHLRYYTLNSLRILLEPHGLDVFRVQKIPTHGGSIRAWICRDGERGFEQSVTDMAIAENKDPLTAERFSTFSTAISRIRDQLRGIFKREMLCVAFGAPSRASTLLQFCGLDAFDILAAFEAPGSQRIGRYLPGTRIEVMEEPSSLEHVRGMGLILSHHISDALAPKIRAKGFKGELIVPLPEVRIVDG